jgi:hypothetical protein
LSNHQHLWYPVIINPRWSSGGENDIASWIRCKAMWITYIKVEDPVLLNRISFLQLHIELLTNI